MTNVKGFMWQMAKVISKADIVFIVIFIFLEIGSKIAHRDTNKMPEADFLFPLPNF